MNSQGTLDLEGIADEWQSDRDLCELDIEAALADERPTRFPRLHRALRARRIEMEGEEDERRYVELTDQLGIDPDPASLRFYAHNYEPTMIAEWAFEDYARELAEDIGAIPDSGWPAHCIDWEQAANELQMDYTSVVFDGEDFLIRA